ncbi:xylulokinase [Leptolyngbya boryana NIES-2135]|uniref:Xylulose kinase n=1 Tax=Leptolyngbya boryana NIES-2135 TaxID=1973484 RepID=A0A1Z4JG11_LEPBY|nr:MULTISPECIES: xylulokinase [Leptolyngbya]BAY55714.1 xylulokinase [Leptolyngbya boryana NIES-2135]MBD2370392.1 xylulokinase [Leptolyngbya sp. FACHB-161]MBD2376736.1 xylulokinase [Leptolyngbya sp. FACHB-238]MBD2401007.1 xylulokinase [Leptolyngbya sp. FACHB-239]MBD2407654.1 xylulokinase [Leptolyngbya sp. FACHB-402]
MADLVIGLDLGTGGVRAIAVDLHGQLMAQTTKSYPLFTPHPGWTEQNPADWVEASLEALSDIAQQLGENCAIALGLSGQMHGMVPLDAEGHVIRPAILWNDQRTGKAVEAIESTISRQELIQRTGNPAITGFQLPKLVWLRTEEPQAYAQVRQILLPKDYLGYVLTGVAVTEPSDASGTGCLNLANRQWDSDILNALKMNPAWFPPVVESTAIAGRLKPEIAAHVGLPAGLPVIAGGGDNAAAAIGLGISASNLNRGSLSIGTSGVIFAPLEHPIPDPEGRVHLFCHADGGYHLLGVTLAAGGSLRWYRDTIAPQIAFADLMQLAERSQPGARGVLFLPHLAGERSPHLDPETRGAWVNLALAHSQADLIRAVLEGVAFSLREALDIIHNITPMKQLLATGGGARSSVWLKILADILQTELIAPKAEEGAAYGAAILAMVGVGVYSNLEAAFQILPQAENVVQPQKNLIYESAFQKYQQLYEALKAVR